MSIGSLIESDLKLSSGFVENAAKNARRYIKFVPVPKKDGGFRLAAQPCNEAKVVQYWLIERILKQMPVSRAAVAYVKDTSIKANAERHLSGKYFLKFDFTNFFPSITFSDFHHVISNCNFEDTVINEIRNDLEVIRQICFDKTDRLVVGFPCSPMISNVVMYSFDEAFLTFLNTKKTSWGICTYTRYADDIVISTGEKNATADIEIEFKKFVKNNATPKLAINTDKTRRMSRAAGNVFFTGIRSCKDNHITVHKKMKDRIRLLLSLAQKNSLGAEDYSKLEGFLSFVLHADPSFYTKLRGKYFNAFSKLDTLKHTGSV